MPLPQPRPSYLVADESQRDRYDIGTPAYSSAGLVLAQVERTHPWTRPGKLAKAERKKWGNVGQSVSPKTRMELFAELQKREAVRTLKSSKLRDVGMLKGLQLAMQAGLGITTNNLEDAGIAGEPDAAAAAGGVGVPSIGNTLAAIQADDHFTVQHYLQAMSEDYNVLAEKAQYRQPSETQRMQEFQQFMQGLPTDGFPLSEEHKAAQAAIEAGKPLTPSQLAAVQQLLLAKYIEALVAQYNTIVRAADNAAKVVVATQLRDILVSSAPNAVDLLATTGIAAAGAPVPVNLHPITAEKLSQIMTKIPVLNANAINPDGAVDADVDAALVGLPRANNFYKARAVATSKAEATYERVLAPRLQSAWDGGVNEQSYLRQMQRQRETIDYIIRNDGGAAPPGAAPGAAPVPSITTEIENILALVEPRVGTLRVGQPINNAVAIAALGNDPSGAPYTLKSLFKAYNANNKSEGFFSDLSAPSSGMRGRNTYTAKQIKDIKTALAWHLDSRRKAWLQRLDEVSLDINPDMVGYRKFAAKVVHFSTHEAMDHLVGGKPRPNFDEIYPNYPADERAEMVAEANFKRAESAYREAEANEADMEGIGADYDRAINLAARVSYYKIPRDIALNQASLRFNAAFIQRKSELADAWMALPDGADVTQYVYKEAAYRMLSATVQAEVERVETAYEADRKKLQRSSEEILAERDPAIVSMEKGVKTKLERPKALLNTLAKRYAHLEGYPLSKALIADVYQMVCHEALPDRSLADMPLATQLMVESIRSALLTTADSSSSQNFYEALEAALSGRTPDLIKGELLAAEAEWDVKRGAVVGAHAGVGVQNAAYDGDNAAYQAAKAALTAAEEHHADVMASNEAALSAKRAEVTAKYQAALDAKPSVQTHGALKEQKAQLDALLLPGQPDAVTVATAATHLAAAQAMGEYHRTHVVEAADLDVGGDQRASIIESMSLAIEFAQAADAAGPLALLQTAIRDALVLSPPNLETLRLAVHAWEAAGGADAQARAAHLAGAGAGDNPRIAALLGAAVPRQYLAYDHASEVIQAFLKAKAFVEGDEPAGAPLQVHHQAITAALGAVPINFENLRVAINPWLGQIVSPLAVELNSVDAGTNLKIARVLQAYHTVSQDGLTAAVVAEAERIKNDDSVYEQTHLDRITADDQFKAELAAVITDEARERVAAARRAITAADEAGVADPGRTTRLATAVAEAKAHNENLQQAKFSDIANNGDILAATRALMGVVVEAARGEEEAAQRHLDAVTVDRDAKRRVFNANGGVHGVANGTAVDAVTAAADALRLAGVALAEQIRAGDPLHVAVIAAFNTPPVPVGANNNHLATFICEVFRDNEFDPAAPETFHDVLEAALGTYAGADHANVQAAAGAIATRLVGNAPAAANIDNAALGAYKAAKDLVPQRAAEHTAAQAALATAQAETVAAEAAHGRAEALHRGKQQNHAEKRAWRDLFNLHGLGVALLTNILTIEARVKTQIATPPRPTGLELRQLQRRLNRIQTGTLDEKYAALLDAADVGELGRLEGNDDHGLTDGLRVLRSIELARAAGVTHEAACLTEADEHNAVALHKALTDAHAFQANMAVPAEVERLMLEGIRQSAAEACTAAKADLAARKAERNAARQALNTAMETADNTSFAEIDRLQAAEAGIAVLEHARALSTDPTHPERTSLDGRLARSTVANYSEDMAQVSALLFDANVIRNSVALKLDELLFRSVLEARVKAAKSWGRHTNQSRALRQRYFQHDPNEPSNQGKRLLLIKEALQKALIEDPTAYGFVQILNGMITKLPVGSELADDLAGAAINPDADIETIVAKELEDRGQQMQSLLTMSKAQRQVAVAMAMTTTDEGRTEADRTRAARLDRRSDREKAEDKAARRETRFEGSTDSRDFIRDLIPRALKHGDTFSAKTNIKTSAGILGKDYKASYTVSETTRGRVTSLSLPSPKKWPKKNSKEEKGLMRDVAKFVDVFVFRSLSGPDLHLKGADMRLAAIVIAYVEVNKLNVEVKGVRKFQMDRSVYNRAINHFAREKATQRKADIDILTEELTPADNDRSVEADAMHFAREEVRRIRPGAR